MQYAASVRPQRLRALYRAVLGGVLLYPLTVVMAEPSMPQAPPSLQQLEAEGKLTVRALRAWDQLPAPFVQLALSLHALDVDLLAADRAALEALMAQAQAADSSLHEYRDALAALAEHMQAVLAAPASSKADLRAQQILARDLSTQIAAHERWEHEAIEALFLRLIKEAPDTPQAQMGYWRLSNLYLQGYTPPRQEQAIALLEQYLARYPDSTLLDEHFAMFAREGLPLVKQRLLSLYQQTAQWDKAVALYAALIPEPAAAPEGLVDHFIAYGRALQGLGQPDQAIAIYQAYLAHATRRSSSILEQAARMELAKLGVVVEADEDAEPPSLLALVTAGDLEGVRALVQAGVDMNAPSAPAAIGFVRQADQYTPLQQAVLQQHRDIVAYLLAQGADVNAVGSGPKGGLPPLILAVEQVDAQITHLLLEAGAPINARLPDERTALLVAAGIRRNAAVFPLLEVLLDAGADPALASRRGDYPFEFVMAGILIDPYEEQGAAAILGRLYHPEIDLNQELTSGWTALHFAALRGAVAFAEALLALGSDVNAQSPRNETPLLLASQVGQLGLVEMLLKRPGIALNQPDQRQHTPLTRAIERGHAEIALRLIAQGADPHPLEANAPSPFHLTLQQRQFDTATQERISVALVKAGLDTGLLDRSQRTLLQLAIEQGLTHTVAALLAQGADPNTADARGNTPLHHAVRQDQPEIVELLLAAGAAVNVANEADEQPLHQAAQQGYTEIIKHLLAKGAEPQATQRHGQMPLHLAARQGHLEAVRLLAQADHINLPVARNQQTALYLAAEGGHQEVVAFLLSLGADPLLADQRGDTPAIRAHARGHEAVLEVLLAHIDTVYPSLHQAAAVGYLDDINRHLERGVAVDAQDEDGHTALHLAAGGNHLAAVQRLLEAGAPVNALNAHQVSALHLAVAYYDPEIVALLIAQGADQSLLANAHSLDQQGDGVLHYALQGVAYDLAYQDALSYLLKQGVNINATNVHGETPLLQLSKLMRDFHQQHQELVMRGWDIDEGMLARQQALREAISQLLAHGAEVNVLDDEQSFSPLHFAVLLGDETLLAELLAHGARLDLPEQGGLQPLHLAINEGQQALTEWLIARGAKPELAQYGPLMLHDAVSRGLFEAVDYLLAQGVDINSRDAQGQTALTGLLGQEDQEMPLGMAEALIARGAAVDPQHIDWPPVRIAALQGDVKQLERLLRRGVAVLAEDSERFAWSVFQAAARVGQTASIEALIAAGADPNEGRREDTPLAQAALHGHAQTVQRLLALGADPTPLDDLVRGAMYQSDLEALSQLVAAGVDLNAEYINSGDALLFRVDDDALLRHLHQLGADINRISRFDETLWHEAIDNGNAPRLALLHELGADIEQTAGFRQRSPLHYAVAANQAALVEQLLSYGAQVNVRDADGNTPLHSAAEEGHIELVQRLLDHQADVHAHNEQGYTPRDLARYSRHAEIFRLLSSAAPSAEQ